MYVYLFVLQTIYSIVCVPMRNHNSEFILIELEHNQILSKKVLMIYILHIEPAICLEVKGLNFPREFQDTYHQIANYMHLSNQ